MSLLWHIYQQGVTVELLILSLYADIYQQGVTYKNSFLMSLLWIYISRE